MKKYSVLFSVVALVIAGVIIYSCQKDQLTILSLFGAPYATGALPSSILIAVPIASISKSGATTPIPSTDAPSAICEKFAATTIG